MNIWHDQNLFDNPIRVSKTQVCLIMFSSEDTTKNICDGGCDDTKNQFKLARHMFVLKCFHLKTQPKYFHVHVSVWCANVNWNWNEICYNKNICDGGCHDTMNIWHDQNLFDNLTLVSKTQVCLKMFSSEDTTEIFSCSCFSLVCKCKLKLKRNLLQQKYLWWRLSRHHEHLTIQFKLARHMFVLKCFHLKTQPKYFYVHVSVWCANVNWKWNEICYNEKYLWWKL